MAREIHFVILGVTPQLEQNIRLYVQKILLAFIILCSMLSFEDSLLLAILLEILVEDFDRLPLV